MERSDELLSELLQRLSQGDSEAAGQVFVAYLPYLRKVIRRQLPAQLRSKLDSLDILQSAWTDVLAGLGKSGWNFESPAQLQSFLVRVMRNRCIDRSRQHRRPLELEEPLADQPIESRQSSPGDIAQANELWDRLWALCPPEYREVLRLKREGASAADIAAATGLHEGSVRRILRQLANRLGESDSQG